MAALPGALDGKWWKVKGNNDLGSYLVVRMPTAAAAPGASCIRGNISSKLFFEPKAGGYVGTWTDPEAGAGKIDVTFENSKLRLHFPDDNTKYIFERRDVESRTVLEWAMQSDSGNLAWGSEDAAALAEMQALIKDARMQNFV
eukprot:gnl/TRDRNA2_/TRDRNA2_219601_c0_seq1.p1 gnl/TRDRNA2_/TRDRNA2_219601_c0~~gnl/TRDRNA2_/TRDRNA2_219601_c0_seq1.p1  ORF type:complete len:162 (+),score=35.91 gnl/TRDRNA2_/TRDRNA2_219601_c0_seq1:59-487(+)